MKHCMFFPDFSTEAVELNNLTVDEVEQAKRILMNQWGYTSYEVIYIDGNIEGYIETTDPNFFHKRIQFIIMPLIKLN